MELHKKIYKKWVELSYKGITEDLTLEEAVKSRLVNIISLICFVWSISLFILICFIGEYSHLFVVGVTFFLQIGLFLLNTNKQQFLARYLVVLIFTIYLPFFWIFIDSNWQMDFVFLLIIFLTFILFTGKRQIFLIILECIACLTPKFIEPLVPDVYKMPIAPLPHVTEYTYVFYIFISSLLLFFYQSEIKKHRKNLNTTIADLQKSNIYLKQVSTELKQFLQIISGDFKNQLQIVHYHLENIDKTLNTQNYKPTLHSLELASMTTQEMYFWVNDILEFSNYNNNKKRTETLTNFNEIINYVKINLSQIHPNFTESLQIEDLPMLKINNLEVFIVFYNLIKIMTANIENTDLTIKSHKIEKDWIILLINNNQALETIEDSKDSSKYLALKFCKMLVKDWNGELTISQSNQKIYSFELRIPIEK